jgi:hypothetical protein
MRPVIGSPPEAAMKEDHQRNAAPGTCQARSVRRGKTQVSNLILARAITQDYIRRGRWPAEDLAYFRRNLPAGGELGLLPSINLCATGIPAVSGVE